MTIDLDALEALEKKATQGEWTTQRFPNGCHFDRILRDGYTVDGVTYVPDYEHPMLCKDDAALIAAARNAGFGLSMYLRTPASCKSCIARCATERGGTISSPRRRSA